MRELSRRQFIGSSSIRTAGIAVGAALGAARRPVRAASANDRIRLATIGAGGRGSRLTRDFSARADTEIVAVSDCDAGRARKLADAIGSSARVRPTESTDLRRVLDDRSIDGVIVATPDHWHALASVLACAARKDVYVEKPASYSIWEGRQMVRAARRYSRIVQVGTQNRSAPYLHEALELIRTGVLGEIHLAKVYNLKPGSPVRVPADGPAPRGVDYDAWLGPAPSRPFNAGHFHGGWYYHYAYCGGDLGNDSIHQLDVARWLTGVRLPSAAHSTGGNFAFDDDRTVPDTQVATFDFDNMIMTFELTQYTPYMQKTNWQHRTGDSFPHWLQNATRIELYGTKRQMIVGRHGGGWQVFTSDGAVEAESHGRFPDAPHQQNFIDAMRTRKLPNADIEEGHLSAVLVHMGNISYRLGGRKLALDADTERFRGDDEANALRRRTPRAPYTFPDLTLAAD